ncbi:MAG TPA: FHA domain-containing protein [Victivallales bacterium]|mgnify:CR=1 FL=1|nr:FHA domain-containing protein [Victivallales bacterium]HPO90958.1 FHA domain-containing protein [Victivallales bacterium]HRR06185.1 FHA domain-containing protein [Victivallales bacterium]HRR28187.1 FHA domain-containing protein [Victivallales bacterium]HRU01151.1 FHA domain-containing protein [Victivallales bacterium]
MPYISYLEKGFKKFFKLPEDKMAIFGREEHVDFQILNDSLVSREHFGIECDENGNYVVIDLGSSNGTFLNGKKLDPNEVTILKDGDKIKIGRMNLEYKLHIEKTKTSDILTQVTAEYKRGKGYNTIMSEIIDSAKKRNK